jgi:hypothetical protein
VSPLAASFAIVTLSLLRRIDEAAPSSHELALAIATSRRGLVRCARPATQPWTTGWIANSQPSIPRPWCHRRLCTAARRHMREGRHATCHMHACKLYRTPSSSRALQHLNKNTHHSLPLYLHGSLHSSATSFTDLLLVTQRSAKNIFFLARLLRTYVRTCMLGAPYMGTKTPQGYKKSTRCVVALVMCIPFERRAIEHVKG